MTNPHDYDLWQIQGRLSSDLRRALACAHRLAVEVGHIGHLESAEWTEDELIRWYLGDLLDQVDREKRIPDWIPDPFRGRGPGQKVRISEADRARLDSLRRLSDCSDTVVFVHVVWNAIFSVDKHVGACWRYLTTNRPDLIGPFSNILRTDAIELAIFFEHLLEVTEDGWRAPTETDREIRRLRHEGETQAKAMKAELMRLLSEIRPHHLSDVLHAARIAKARQDLTDHRFQPSPPPLGEPRPPGVPRRTLPLPGLGDSTEEQEAWYRSRLAELEEAVRALGAEPWPACEPPSLPEHLIVPWRNSDGPPLGPGLDLGADPTHKVGDGVGELIRYLVSRKR